jgi:hypothetical protein
MMPIALSTAIPNEVPTALPTVIPTAEDIKIMQKIYYK